MKSNVDQWLKLFFKVFEINFQKRSSALSSQVFLHNYQFHDMNQSLDACADSNCFSLICKQWQWPLLHS